MCINALDAQLTGWLQKNIEAVLSRSIVNDEVVAVRTVTCSGSSASCLLLWQRAALLQHLLTS
jgi:hypothetical protein